MSLEAQTAHLLQKRSTRRSFTKGLITFTGLVAAGVPVAKFSIQSPEAQPHTVRNDYDLYHGSLEDKAMQRGINKLIDPADHGHFPLVKDVVLHDPIAFALTREIFAESAHNYHAGKKFRPGDLYLNTYHSALDKLQTNTAQQKIDPTVNLHLEAMHHSMYAVAAFGAPFFSYDEVVQLGAPVEAVTADQMSWWWLSEGGLGRETYPRFYGDKYAPPLVQGEPFRHGEDRFMHMTNHAFLTFMYRYLHDVEPHHPLITAVPRIVNWSMLAGRRLNIIKTDTDEAFAFAAFLGLAYEVHGTLFPLDNAMRSFRNVLSKVGLDDFTPVEGLLDPFFWQDIDANTLGSHAGNRLYVAGREKVDPTKTANYLNDARHKHIVPRNALTFAH